LEHGCVSVSVWKFEVMQLASRLGEAPILRRQDMWKAGGLVYNTLFGRNFKDDFKEFWVCLSLSCFCWGWESNPTWITAIATHSRNCQRMVGTTVASYLFLDSSHQMGRDTEQISRLFANHIPSCVRKRLMPPAN